MGGLWHYPRKWGWETLGCLTWAEERPGGEPGWRKLQKDWGWKLQRQRLELSRDGVSLVGRVPES